jgi:hypothetical protein
MVRRASSILLAAATLMVWMVTSVPQPAAAQTAGGTLFGLNPAPGAVFAIDPSTGASTKLADLPADASGQPPTFFGLASDPDHHLLYTIRAFYTDSTFTTLQWQVVTIDSRSGAASMSLALALDVPNDLAFDPSSGDLFGISGNQPPQSVVRIDPVTGSLTHVADLPGQFAGRFAFASATHTLFVPTQEIVGSAPVNVVVAVNTQDGSVSQSPGMALPINQVVFDTASDALFGEGGFPASIYNLDMGTGAQTLIAPLLGSGFFAQVLTVDSATHTIYAKTDDFSTGSDAQSIQSVNDVTGASSVSTGTVTTDFYINTLAFEGAPAITPDSVAADVRQAFASGAILSSGLENALLAQLGAASSARSRGQCSTAASIYSAVVNTIKAQSGLGIDSSTATRLITEIQFLIDHCP